MSDKTDLKSIISSTHEAAQQLILELVRAGAYNSKTRPGKSLCEDFDTIHTHFEQVKKDLTSK